MKFGSENKDMEEQRTMNGGKNITLFLLIFAVIVIAFLAAKERKTRAGRTITIILVAFVGIFLGKATDLISFPPIRGPWSEWSSSIPSESDSRQIEERKVTSYIMEVYVTQEDVAPNYCRVFRHFSINKDFQSYGARKSYGEKHIQTTVSEEEFNKAIKFGKEYIDFDSEKYVEGYNVSSQPAYVMEIELDEQGRYYPLFVKDKITEVQYRYRDKTKSNGNILSIFNNS